MYKKLGLFFKTPSNLVYSAVILACLFIFVWVGYTYNSHRLISVINDEAIHFASAIHYRDLLENPSSFSFDKFLAIDKLYPPVFAFSAAVTSMFFGRTPIAFLAVHIFYLALLVFSTYMIAKKIFKDSAFLTLIILLSYPMVSYLFNVFMLEFSLMAMVSFALFCILYCDSFANRKFSILLGLSLGIGMGIKWTFCFFIIGPLLYLIATMNYKGNRGAQRNLFLCFLISLALVAPWVSYHFFDLLGRIHPGVIRIGEPIPFWSFKSLFFYPASFYFQMSLPLIVIFLFALFFLKSIQKRYIIFLLSWVLGVFLILLVIPNKWGHYIAPVLPAFSLISGAGLQLFLAKYDQRKVYCLFLWLGAVLVFLGNNFSYSNLPLADDRMFTKLEKVFGQNTPKGYLSALHRYLAWSTADFLVPRVEDFNKDTYRGIFSYFARAQNESGRPLNIGVVDIKAQTLFTLEQLGLIYLPDKLHFYSFIYEPTAFISNAAKLDFIIISMDEDANAYKYYFAKTVKKEKLIDLSKGDIYFENIFKNTLPGILGRFEAVDSYNLYSYKSDKDSLVYILKRRTDSPGNVLIQRWPAIIGDMLIHGPAHNRGESAQLQFGEGRLKFDRGKWKVFLGNRELTKGLGVYTSLRSFGIWHDSTQAVWKIHKLSDRELLVFCFFRTLPVWQIWKFQVKDGSLFWEVTTNKDMFVKLEEEQANISLSKAYHLQPDNPKRILVAESLGKSGRVGEVAVKKHAYLKASHLLEGFPEVALEASQYTDSAEGLGVDFSKGIILRCLYNHSMFYFGRPGSAAYFKGRFGLKEMRAKGQGL